MRISKKKLNQTIEKVISRNKEELYKYRVDELSFQYVNIKKNRNREDYDIIVSIDEIEVPLSLIRDIVDEACQELDIKVGRTFIEL
ncbi:MULTISPECIES: hypothetical protein [unclassified Clostridioides]|uniref:hypothetical protein n=1 Tax=unclassified Clostridioides TaxID=2635829 RepID=UPI001D11CC0F|nr:hypothetical protein [Clostridioides difficile]MCC0672211.1 hypothetical protein [Clostridioides sp. ES-S-0145-01]MCC0681908.1 hypothetical protein [Clostridioides sp. ES-S-0005-03]MCC0709342.1 hypothetical protein [Clostridioides sp. ES-S-0190-01]UDN64103.1 hypothetical protein IC758_19705 [Clostridioides sp. ES-W-0016-02]